MMTTAPALRRYDWPTAECLALLGIAGLVPIDCGEYTAATWQACSGLGEELDAPVDRALNDVASDAPLI